MIFSSYIHNLDMANQFHLYIHFSQCNNYMVRFRLLDTKTGTINTLGDQVYDACNMVCIINETKRNNDGKQMNGKYNSDREVEMN